MEALLTYCTEVLDGTAYLRVADKHDRTKTSKQDEDIARGGDKRGEKEKIIY